MTEKRPMPIGIQTFEDIITRKFAYVDKTAFVYKMATEGKPYFLARPRRFGKSLFLSTLESYFLGKKDLFKNLALEKLEEQAAKDENRETWINYPVFRFDFNAQKYDEKSSLINLIDSYLARFEKEFNVDSDNKEIHLRFKKLIQVAHEQTGRQVVILVDEYDKPLLETLDNPELFEENRKTIKAFFSNLKSEDAHIRFAFLTGVTKFPQVSIFSDLNNLKDISMNPKFNAICGISETELVENFDSNIEELAETNQLTKKECLEKLQKTYDGYHFFQHTEGIYNPFSLLNTFDSGTFNYYWFATGTPTFLIQGIEKNHFDIRQLVEGVSAPVSLFSEYKYDSERVEPLLYQSGYLTIKDFDKEFNSYVLKFPNEEVKYGFLNNLLSVKTSVENDLGPFYIQNFVKDIRACKVDAFMTRLQSILSSVPYSVYGEKQIVTEQTFQTGIFLVFQLMGQFTQCEVHSAKGRADAVVWTKDAIYVFEFKLNGTSEEALLQIEDKSYAIQYQADDKKIVKIGVGFEKDIPVIKDWVVKE